MQKQAGTNLADDRGDLRRLLTCNEGVIWQLLRLLGALSACTG